MLPAITTNLSLIQKCQSMKARFFISIFLMALIGCSTESVISNTETPSSPVPSVIPEPKNQFSSADPTASPQISPAASEALTISAMGIGTARLGMTLGQLKQVLGSDAELKVVSPFIVDFDAIALSKSGKVQYYILYPAETNLADSDVVEALVTDNPDYQTAEGVGPGTPLKQAEAVYGEAVLFYNTLNESREYVRFANQLAKNIYFRPVAVNHTFVGIYPSPSGEYNQTKKFQETALIRLVEVVCLPQICTKP